MIKPLCATTIGLILCLSISSASASEKKLALAAVPKAVVAALKHKYTVADDQLQFAEEKEHGKISYEVVVKVDGRVIEVELSPAGKIVAEEERIKPEELPAAVTQAIAASKHAGATIKGAERVILDEKVDAPNYEVVVEESGKKLELKFDATGKLVEEEEKTGRKE